MNPKPNQDLQSVYAFTTLFFSLGWPCTHPEDGGCQAATQSFSYFTVLTYWGLAFYFAVSAAHTFTYARSGSALLDRFPRPLQALHSLYYTTIVTLPFLVTIVYWGVLYKGPWFKLEYDAWGNISKHGLNSAFALFELVVPRTLPPFWIHIPYLILILLGYLAVAYITLASQGWYTYSFLDHDAVHERGYVAAYIFGIAVGIIIIFIVVWCLIKLRVWATETKCQMMGKFAAERQPSADEEAQRKESANTDEGVHASA